MDKIVLNSIQEKVSIGVYAWEHEVTQTLTFDISMGLSNPARADLTLAEAVNYAEVMRCLRDYVTSQHFELIENLAAGLSDRLVDEFKIPWIRIVIHKPRLTAGLGSASIEIERSIETANDSV